MSRFKSEILSKIKTLDQEYEVLDYNNDYYNYKFDSLNQRISNLQTTQSSTNNLDYNFVINWGETRIELIKSPLLNLEDFYFSNSINDVIYSSSFGLNTIPDVNSEMDICPFYHIGSKFSVKLLNKGNNIFDIKIVAKRTINKQTLYEDGKYIVTFSILDLISIISNVIKLDFDNRHFDSLNKDSTISSNREVYTVYNRNNTVTFYLKEVEDISSYTLNYRGIKLIIDFVPSSNSFNVTLSYYIVIYYNERKTANQLYSDTLLKSVSNGMFENSITITRNRLFGSNKDIVITWTEDGNLRYIGLYEGNDCYFGNAVYKTISGVPYTESIIIRKNNNAAAYFKISMFWFYDSEEVWKVTANTEDDTITLTFMYNDTSKQFYKNTTRGKFIVDTKGWYDILRPFRAS